MTRDRTPAALAATRIWSGLGLTDCAGGYGGVALSPVSAPRVLCVAALELHLEWRYKVDCSAALSRVSCGIPLAHPTEPSGDVAVEHAAVKNGWCSLQDAVGRPHISKMRTVKL